MKRFIEKALSEKQFDFEAVEVGLRIAVLAAGAKKLEEIINIIGRGRRDKAVVCDCGTRMESHGLYEKRIKGTMGDMMYRRSRFVCPACGKSRYPGDEILGVVNTEFSPGLVRLMARAGHKQTFKDGSDDLKEYSEIKVGAKDVERVAESIGREIEEWEKKTRESILSSEAPIPLRKDIPIMYVSYDGTGVPMVPWELEGRKGKQADGSAKTREAKLGCVFTQTATDEDGYPARDDASTTFVGAIENSNDFGWRIYGEALARGLDKADKVVVIGDGAKWIWAEADLHFGCAIQIVDLYHAREHLHNLASLLAPNDDKIKNKLAVKWRTMLDEGKVEKIVKDATELLPKSGTRKKSARREIDYFDNNKERMRYNVFREQGLFVGSGVVEAGCKTVIGARLKQSGMEWTQRGANAIIPLRCCYVSGKIESFWESRNS